ncbi:uncharacterized protein METZ01_LOCUS41342, partial [marine metagenome]
VSHSMSFRQRSWRQHGGNQTPTWRSRQRLILYSERSSSPSVRFETKPFPIPQEMRVRTPGLRSQKSKQD